MNERECTLEDAREALEFIQPESGRKEWMEIAFALRAEFGDAGFEVFDQWSRQGDSYKPQEMPGVWRSVKPSGRQGTVGIGTLFKRAMDNGYQFKPRTDDEREEFRQEAERRRKLRVAEEIAERERLTSVHAAISSMSRELWDNHLQADGTSEYLDKKSVRPFGVRFPRHSAVAWVRPEDGQWGIVTGSAGLNKFWSENKQYDRETNPAPYSFRHLKAGTIAIPLVDGESVIWSLQLIYPSGAKSFFKDGRKQGLFHLLGDSPAPSYEGRLWVAEGYSSAASVHMAVGEPTVMAVDSGNLPVVAKTLREKYPAAHLVIAADNDCENTQNSGVEKAREAALAVGGQVAIPIWPDEVAA